MADKKVQYALIYGDNAFTIVGEWAYAAKRAGWTPEEVQKVKDEAFNASSYQEFTWIIASYCED